MTDITPVPQQPQISNVLSMDQIRALEQRVRENKAAQLRGEKILPHDVTPEMLRDAIQSIRAQRGTLDFAKREGGGKKKSGGKSGVEIQILDDM